MFGSRSVAKRRFCVRLLPERKRESDLRAIFHKNFNFLGNEERRKRTKDPAPSALSTKRNNSPTSSVRLRVGGFVSRRTCASQQMKARSVAEFALRNLQVASCVAEFVGDPLLPSLVAVRAPPSPEMLKIERNLTRGILDRGFSDASACGVVRRCLKAPSAREVSARRWWAMLDTLADRARTEEGRAKVRKAPYSLWSQFGAFNDGLAAAIAWSAAAGWDAHGDCPRKQSWLRHRMRTVIYAVRTVLRLAVRGADPRVWRRVQARICCSAEAWHAINHVFHEQAVRKFIRLDAVSVLAAAERQLGIAVRNPENFTLAAEFGSMQVLDWMSQPGLATIWEPEVWGLPFTFTVERDAKTKKFRVVEPECARVTRFVEFRQPERVRRPCEWTEAVAKRAVFGRASDADVLRMAEKTRHSKPWLRSTFFESAILKGRVGVIAACTDLLEKDHFRHSTRDRISELVFEQAKAGTLRVPEKHRKTFGHALHCFWNARECRKLVDARDCALLSATLKALARECRPCLFSSWGLRSATSLLARTATKGNWEVVDVLLSFGVPRPSPRFFGNVRGMCVKAASAGDFGVLSRVWPRGKWDCDFNCGRVCVAAAASGRVDVLQWLLAAQLAKAENDPDPRGKTAWPAEVVAAAAGAGEVAVLEWLRREDDGGACPWGSHAPAQAAAKGQVRALEWLRTNGCPWDARTFEAATAGGHEETMRWLRENRCPWNGGACKAAAAAGRVDLLEWLHDSGCPWDERSCAAAASKGRTGVLKWLRDKGCPWDARALSAAIGGNHDDSVLFILSFERGIARCPLSAEALALAAEKGRFDWVRKAVSIQEAAAPLEVVPWDTKVGEAAAGVGNLEMLKWLRAESPERSAGSKCPLTRTAALEAARMGHLDVLKWLRGTGPDGRTRCRMRWKRVRGAAARSGNEAVLDWLNGEFK